MSFKLDYITIIKKNEVKVCQFTPFSIGFFLTASPYDEALDNGLLVYIESIQEPRVDGWGSNSVYIKDSI